MQSRRMSREPPCVDPDDPVGVFPGPSDGATHHAPERWRETVSAEAVTHLRREGWCVIDGFLSGADGGGGASFSIRSCARLTADLLCESSLLNRACDAERGGLESCLGLR